MTNFLVQVQLLLGALGALLPLVPERSRVAAADVLRGVADAVVLAVGASANLEDLAVKLKDLRAEIETMAETGSQATVGQIETAFACVTAASAAFRAALN